jgi:hypothetical protein
LCVTGNFKGVCGLQFGIDKGFDGASEVGHSGVGRRGRVA